MTDVDHVEYKRHEQGQSISADVELFGVVRLRHHRPFACELMSIDIRQFADLPDLAGKLALEKSEHSSLFELARDDRRGDVIEPTALGSAIELNRQAAPSLDGPLLFLGLEHDRSGRCRPTSKSVVVTELPLTSLIPCIVRVFCDMLPPAVGWEPP